MREELAQTLQEIREAGLHKPEHRLSSAQSAHITTVSAPGAQARPALCFCANNYLGLADHPEVKAAAAAALERWGFGMASVRFICGTHEMHKRLEAALSAFLEVEDAIVYPSCFDANGGLFEVLFDERDTIISDELNHASLIDGIRLCKAERRRYPNADMAALEAELAASQAARRRVIVTDGVFSMDGSFAPLDQICELAERHDALVMVDDSHAVGFVGERGRGTPELFGVADRVDILTGTLGKALGGASGGYVAARQEVVDLLRQRSRPYLFSNALPPMVAAGSLKALEVASSSGAQRQALAANTTLFRELMAASGFDVLPGTHPICPVMFPGEDGARRAGAIAESMLALGVYVIAFSYPVVPKGKARIRVQLSADHSAQDITACVAAFQRAAAELS